MAVTPKGIVTPDASSPYNLITDLNTLASTTDAAIATQKGTASQRTAAVAGAPDGTLWQDTDGIKMIWRKDGAAWVPAVTRWVGTTAQMDAFTQAPVGFEWFNTSDSSKYVRLGGFWAVFGKRWLASVTSPQQTGIAGTATTLTGLTVSVSLSAATRVLFTAQTRGNGPNFSETVVEFGLRNNGVEIAKWTRTANSGNTPALTSSHTLVSVQDLAAGSHTLTVTARVVAGGGTYTSQPQVGEPNFLLVETK